MSINKNSNDDFFFHDNFEVTLEEDLEEIQADIKDDAYKDALSALSELDDTQSFDYLEANKTRTLRIGEIEEYMRRHQELEQEMNKTPLEKAFDSCKKFIHTFTPKK
jgi:hypothetical protein